MSRLIALRLPDDLAAKLAHRGRPCLASQPRTQDLRRNEVLHAVQGPGGGSRRSRPCVFLVYTDCQERSNRWALNRSVIHESKL